MHSYRYMFVVLALALASAAGLGSRAEYVGGTLAHLKNGTEGSIQTMTPGSMLFAAKGRTIEVRYDQINLLEYGQRVSRRIGMAVVVSPLFVLSKSRKHYLTIGYTDPEGQQQALVFRVDKDDVRSVLAGLEARTGIKITYQDEESRKAGKG